MGPSQTVTCDGQIFVFNSIIFEKIVSSIIFQNALLIKALFASKTIANQVSSGLSSTVTSSFAKG